MNIKNISVEATDKVLSANSGLIYFEKLWNELNLDKKLRRLLPKKKKNKGPAQINKFKGILYSFALGNDCIADLDDLRNDRFFVELCGDLASRTAGDFLNSFQSRYIEKLQDVLLEMTIKLRLSQFNDKKFILSMDSTPHKQCGKKMEKLGKNYKGIWGFDSQNAYDQYGFSYLFDLRSGGTYSGKDAEAWIYKIFSKIPEHMDRFFRADSAYGSHAVFRALRAAESKFTIILKENIGKYVRKKNRNLLNWKKTELEFFNSKDCEMSMGLYPVKGLGSLRVVFIRLRKDEDEIRERQLLLFEKYNPEEDDYRHYSIITNIESQEMNGEEIVEFYRGRANCENYIKEQKYGFDFLNFPCKKFVANRTWGLIGSLAHNLTRFLSFNMDQKIKRVRDKKSKKMKTVVQLGYFAKTVRNKIIKLPCQMVRSARKIKLRLERHNEEVHRRLMWKIQENIVCEFTT